MNDNIKSITMDATWNIISSGTDFATDFESYIATGKYTWISTWNVTRIDTENSLKDICYE